MGIAKHNGITRTSAESLSVKNKNADIDKSIVQVSNSECSIQVYLIYQNLVLVIKV